MTDFASNCIHGDYILQNRIVYAAYSEAFGKGDAAQWLANNVDKWRRVGDAPAPMAAPVASTIVVLPAATAVEYSAEAKARNEARYSPRKHALIAAADAYDKLGYAPIKLKSRSKEGPAGWDKQHLTGETAAGYLDTDSNIGCLNGAKSGARIDLDLDWPEAAKAADVVFGALPAFGRVGKPRSHRLTICPDIKSLKLELPATLKSDARFQGEHGLVICEIRASGQTVFPPSVHPCGEVIEWQDGRVPDAIPPTDAPTVQKHMTAVALTALAMRCHPGEGSRNDTLLAFNGALLRILDGDVALTDRLAGVVAGAWRYNETRPQAAATWAKLQAAEECIGLPTLLERLGLPADLTKAINADWLAISDGRPRVVINDFDTNTTLDHLDAALLAANVPVYQRGGQLVHAYRQDKDDAEDEFIQRRAGSIGIHVVEDTRLTLYFDERLTFGRPNKDGEIKRQSTQGFGFLARYYAARIDRCGLPVLDGVIECPTLRADGSLISEQGYDRSSGLILDSANLVVPPIPENPIHDDAMGAMNMLTELFNEFPFAPDHDEYRVGTLDQPSASRSVAISGVLTGIALHALDSTPIHGADANSISSGKSTICNVTAAVVTGREASAMTLPANEEEAVKAWLSVLMNGDQVICIDNVDKGNPVGGGVLAKVITEPRFKTRILGVNKTADVSTKCLKLVNGNNLIFAADLASRAIKSRLDAGRERPQERTFKRDVVAYAKEHRSELIAACLTVLRAYIVAGRPRNFTPSRFRQWDQLVRGAIIWCGQPDPYLTAQDIDASDPERADIAALLEAFADCFGDQVVTSKEVAAKIEEDGTRAVALRNALAGHTKGQVGQRTITAILRSHDGTIVNGRRFRRHANSSQVVQFWVETVGGLL